MNYTYTYTLTNHDPDCSLLLIFNAEKKLGALTLKTVILSTVEQLVNVIQFLSWLHLFLYRVEKRHDSSSISLVTVTSHCQLEQKQTWYITMSTKEKKFSEQFVFQPCAQMQFPLTCKIDQMQSFQGISASLQFRFLVLCSFSSLTKMCSVAIENNNLKWGGGGDLLQFWQTRW